MDIESEASIALSIWFETSWEFYTAARRLHDLELVPYTKGGQHYTLLKERGTDRMGFGFYDLELGLMCKLTL